MLSYKMPEDEVKQLISNLGFQSKPDLLKTNYSHYYLTSHGSTLSRVLHVHLCNMMGEKDVLWGLY